jgi:hypothetical protein
LDTARMMVVTRVRWTWKLSSKGPRSCLEYSAYLRSPLCTFTDYNQPHTRRS